MRRAFRWLLCCLALLYLCLLTASLFGTSSLVPSLRQLSAVSHSSLAIHHIPSATRNALRAACGSLEACISIHLFLYNRIDATASLLEALTAADYSSYGGLPIPLVLHVDVPDTEANELEKAEAQIVQHYASHYTWPHGPLVLDIKSSHMGSKGSWLSAWDDPGPNDLMIAFEDDMMPSPLYYRWLLKVLHDYKLLQSGRDKNLLGVSLSPIRLDEISYPFRPWEASTVIGSKSTLYLHAVPSSWGAAYFGDQWSQFSSFARLRGAPPFFPEEGEAARMAQRSLGTKLGDPNLWLPDSRANSWAKSWKSLMVDFAFGRGAYMLYPNLPNTAGLATCRFLVDDHSYATHDPTTDPRIASLAEEKSLDLATEPPDYKSLPLVDLHGLPIERRELAKRGDDFLRGLNSLGPKYHHLTSTWQRSCLLDQEQRKSSQSMSADERFLVFQPQMGLNVSLSLIVSGSSLRCQLSNRATCPGVPCLTCVGQNQMRGILHGAIWAHTLGRTLVLPRLFWPRLSEAVGTVPYHEVFNPGDVASILPGLKYVYEDEALISHWNASRYIKIESTPTFGQLTYDYLKHFRWDSLPVVDLLKKRADLSTRDGLYSQLGSCDDEVMVLDGLFFQQSLVLDKYAELWKEFYRPSALVQRVINAVQSKLIFSKAKTYDCVHMRFGDFAHLCSGESSSNPWIGRFRKNGWKCSITREQAVSRTSRLSADALLVLSDEPGRAISFLSGSTKRLITSKDVSDYVKKDFAYSSAELRGIVSALVEQRLCADAGQCILNAYSTFSRGVGFYRGHGRPTEYW